MGRGGIGWPVYTVCLCCVNSNITLRPLKWSKREQMRQKEGFVCRPRWEWIVHHHTVAVVSYAGTSSDWVWGKVGEIPSMCVHCIRMAVNWVLSTSPASNSHCWCTESFAGQVNSGTAETQCHTVQLTDFSFLISLHSLNTPSLLPLPRSSSLSPFLSPSSPLSLCSPYSPPHSSSLLPTHLPVSPLSSLLPTSLPSSLPSLHSLSQHEERRVATLENHLSELSETVGNYDRQREGDQQAILWVSLRSSFLPSCTFQLLSLSSPTAS